MWDKKGETVTRNRQSLDILSVNKECTCKTALMSEVLVLEVEQGRIDGEQLPQYSGKITTYRPTKAQL